MTLKGQSKLINCARLSFKITQYALPHAPSHQKAREMLEAGSTFLGCAKFMVRVLKIPDQSHAVYTDICKIEQACKTLYAKWMAGEKIESREIWSLTFQLAYTIKKILSLVGAILFKPLLLIDKQISLGQEGENIYRAWQVISVVKSALKIYAYIGFLSTDNEKRVSRSCELILEGWKFTHLLLNMNGVAVHPYARLALAASKCFFDLIQLWQKAS